MRRKLLLLGLVWIGLAFTSLSQSTIIKGLTVIVEFSDASFHNSIDSVSLMMNQPDFAGWGNEGSVRDYFLTQSDGKVLITSTVIKVSLAHPGHEYYGDNATRRDLSDIVDAINAAYPQGFTDLTLKPDNSLVHFNILTKKGGGAWAFGAQPGSNTIKNNGQDVFVYSGNITNYNPNEDPQHNTVCHEMGHNVMEWPDYYGTAWSNLGNYCSMASAGNRKQPQVVNPAMRLKNGWIDNVIEIGALPYDQTYTAVSNSYNTIYKYTNPYNPKEYLLIHPQVYGKYYQERLDNEAVADQGLAIYYVDEEGGMDLPGMESAYSLKLLQADNKNELQDEDLRFATSTNNGWVKKVRGDYDDLYDNVRNSFPNGTPFRWKDGGEFGLILGEISAPGATMDFTVYARTNTHIVRSDKNGSVSPKGIIDAPLVQTYTLLPNPGYEVNQVTVNGTVTTVSGNSFTVNGIGTKNINVSYKRKINQDQLPSPWQQADIGSPSTTGFSAHQAGKFHVESHGQDIWGNYDSFRFVYRTLSGDGSIVTQLSSLNRINNWSKAGIMIRESLDPNAAYSMLMHTPRNHSRVQQRTSAGAYATDNPNKVKDLHFYELYKWFKITRTGNIITSYVSRDQQNWVLLGNQTIPMPATVYVGLAVSGVNGGNATVAQFGNVTVTASNAAPTISISSPANNAEFFAPASVQITANASDVDGSIDKVEFYNGGVLIGTDYTAPYSYTWNNVNAGNYIVIAKATDNNGAFTSTSVTIKVIANTPSEPIVTSAACGSNNTTVLFEVNPANRANATSYNWWYTGSSQNILPVSGAAYQANLATGNYFSAGQVCVGINYSSSPWYSSYCVNFSKCAGAREGDGGNELEESQAIGFPNPFTSEVVLQLPTAVNSAAIQVYNASGVLVVSTTVTGTSYTFGEELNAGIYFVKVNYAGKSETLKLVKE